jgi:uncharacterized protein YcnI
MKRIRPARLLAAVVVLLAMAAPALAHVTVNPSSAAKGSFAKLTFRVPNERDDAGTAKVEVFLPTDHPIENVSVKPVPGWTATVDKQHVTWSGGTIKPGEFQEFDLSVGPLPDNADKLVFKAIQTYSDGEVVRWIEEAAEGASEPEHPAPVLTLTAATGDHHDSESESGSESAAGGSSSSSDGTARALGGAGLVLGLVGALAAVAALTRGRN